MAVRHIGDFWVVSPASSLSPSKGSSDTVLIGPKRGGIPEVQSVGGHRMGALGGTSSDAFSVESDCAG